MEEQLRKLDPTLFNQLNHDQRRGIAKLVTRTLAQSYSGPIPPPELLSRFNELIPNGADRIMRQAENQSAHRINIETVVVTSQQSLSSRGQSFAFIIGMVGLLLGFIAIMSGHEWAGVTISGGAVVSLVYAFITGQNNQKKDLASKRPRAED